MANASDTDQPTPLPAAGAEGVLYLVDISGYVFRAFYALPPLTSERGEPTGALYGVTTMLLKLVRERQPHLLAVVMDGKGHSFRKELYRSYKANRPSAPDDLKQQMGKVREVGEAYSIPCYEREGVEADDLIASLTKQARAAGYPVVIVSADKDLLQLVGDGVWMLDTMKQQRVRPAETQEKLGVPPGAGARLPGPGGRQLGQHAGRALGGAQDRGGAARRSIGSLEGVYERSESSRRRRSRPSSKSTSALAYLSRDLVTLKDDFELRARRAEAALRRLGRRGAAQVREALRVHASDRSAGTRRATAAVRRAKQGAQLSEQPAASQCAAPASCRRGCARQPGALGAGSARSCCAWCRTRASCRRSPGHRERGRCSVFCATEGNEPDRGRAGRARA